MKTLYTTESGIEVKVATSAKDCSAIAIHRLNADADDIEDALCTAERDGFTCIVLHTIATWPGAQNCFYQFVTASEVA